MVRRVAFAGVLATAFAVVAHGPAAACSVFFTWRVVPSPLAPAPRDTHAWVRVPGLEWATTDLESPCAATRSCPAPSFRLELVEAETGASVPIAVPFTHRTGSGYAWVELVPKAPLKAATRYEVVRVDASGRLPRSVRGTFVTGSEQGAPAPPSPSASHFPAALMHGEGVAIDAPLSRTEAPLFYAVWTGSSANGATAPAWPPLALLGEGGTPSFGPMTFDLTGGACAPGLRLPAQRPLSLLVATVDTAGRMSATRTVTLP